MAEVTNRIKNPAKQIPNYEHVNLEWIVRFCGGKLWDILLASKFAENQGILTVRLDPSGQIKVDEVILDCTVSTGRSWSFIVAAWESSESDWVEAFGVKASRVHQDVRRGAVPTKSQ